MKKINCVVADDEMLAREVILSHISKLNSLQLVATCADGIETYNVVTNQPVDLLFLDIQMPQLNGMALLKTLSNPPAVILTTAYREFALESYEFNVIDYLLKPVSFERFFKAIDKHFRYTGNELTSFLKAGNLDFIYIKSDKKMIKVLLKDITYLEGLKDYVKVHTTTSGIITHQTLSYFNEKLPADQFIRIHRSYIVAMGHLTAYTATRLEIGKIGVPIGASYAKEISSKLGI
jgi:DNA-binding LytR/AlgR family response regulator